MVHVQAILCILCTVHKIFLMFLFVFCFRGCPNEALAQWLAKPEQNGRQAIHLVQVIEKNTVIQTYTIQFQKSNIWTILKV